MDRKARNMRDVLAGIKRDIEMKEKQIRGTKIALVYQKKELRRTKKLLKTIQKDSAMVDMGEEDKVIHQINAVVYRSWLAFANVVFYINKHMTMSNFYIDITDNRGGLNTFLVDFSNGSETAQLVDMVNFNVAVDESLARIYWMTHSDGSKLLIVRVNGKKNSGLKFVNIAFRQQIGELAFYVASTVQVRSKVKKISKEDREQLLHEGDLYFARCLSEYRETGSCNFSIDFSDVEMKLLTLQKRSEEPGTFPDKPLTL